MAQDAQIIDLRRSYVPIDPNAFPVTELDTTGEDAPEPRIPVIPYNGYNFMPTPQGYSSFFGINNSLDVSTLIASGGTGNVDDMFMIQTLTLDNILVALCDDGIWTKSATATGDWDQIIMLTPPDEGEHKNWSKCVLENEVFVYRQGEASHWKATPANFYVFTPEIPTFLNMTGQLGIFKAGGRLGYWDSENSISWSELGNTQNFVPDPDTLAGNTIFQDIVGKITVVLQNGTGFIVYCTKAIVQVSRNVGSPMLWQGKALFNNNGVSYREEVAVAEPDVTHFAFTTQGLVQITGTPTITGTVNVNAEFINPEISTYLKEKRQPVYLKMLNGRYLFFLVLDSSYLSGEVTFTREDIPENVLEFADITVSTDDVTLGYGDTCRAMAALDQAFDQFYLYSQFAITSFSSATDPSVVPIWEDRYSTAITVAVLNAFKQAGLEGVGHPDYFTEVAFANGGIPKLGGGTEYFIPTTARNLQLVSAYTPVETIADNDRDFWNKQDWLWFYEKRFYDYWKEAIYKQLHNSNLSASSGYQDSTETAETVTVVVTPYEFGPYLDLSYFSEANKYYGYAEKSAWLQRSLTKGVIVEVHSIETTSNIRTGEVSWSEQGGTVGFPVFNTFAECIAGIGDILAIIDIDQPGTAPHVGQYTGELFTPKRAMFEVKDNGVALTGTPNVAYIPTGGASSASIVPGAVYTADINIVQKFSVPRFKSVDYNTCVYKNIGYTKIKGHGHYNIATEFVVDDSTAEAADYTDICLIDPPAKKKQSSFFGVPVSDTPCTFGGTVTIDGEDYTFPGGSVVIPAGSILLQQGSIEPIYPTFLGAFIFDIHYKKWGKMKQNCKRIFDYFPINNVAGDGIVPYDIFLPKASMLGEDGLIYIFDQFPSDSYIIYGKIGLNRKGFTQSEEIRVLHRNAFTGSVQLEVSLDSRNIDPALTISRPYTATTDVVAPAGSSGRWFNIKIEGNYDMIGLEFRGHKTSRR